MAHQVISCAHQRPHQVGPHKVGPHQAEPYEVQPYEPANIDDIPPGPGLFTGEEGEWILYKR